MKTNGLAAVGLNTDSNDSSSLQNGQISSTEEEGSTNPCTITSVQAGMKREASFDDENANDAGDSLLASSDEPLLKKAKIIEAVAVVDGEESNSTPVEALQPLTTVASEPTPIESTNGDGH